MPLCSSGLLQDNQKYVAHTVMSWYWTGKLMPIKSFKWWQSIWKYRANMSVIQTFKFLLFALISKWFEIFRKDTKNVRHWNNMLMLLNKSELLPGIRKIMHKHAGIVPLVILHKGVWKITVCCRLAQNPGMRGHCPQKILNKSQEIFKMSYYNPLQCNWMVAQSSQNTAI